MVTSLALSATPALERPMKKGAQNETDHTQDERAQKSGNKAIYREPNLEISTDLAGKVKQ
jgi:hypothetical protein